VFGSAERLGTTANNCTVDGYLQRSAEYTAWIAKGESLATVEDKLNKLSAVWWQAKLARLPGLQVRQQHTPTVSANAVWCHRALLLSYVLPNYPQRTHTCTQSTS
jgi:hypothetical protein